jgi:peptidyl-prolyl cis-trans isomerase C
MKKYLATAATVALLSLTAVPVWAQNIATVNGKPIPKARLDVLEAQIKQQTGQPVSPEMEKNIKDRLISSEIFVQEAERQGIPATPEFRNQLELARQGIMMNMLFDNYIKQHPVSDADAKAEYDRLVKQMAAEQAGAKEYKASHILVEKEDQAKDIIAQLKKGAKFADLAKKYSKDPGSAAKGGELGWANPKTYVPEFAAALTKLNKDQTTDTPVKTQFGYHIIHLEDVRDSKPTPPPPFDAVKQQVTQQLEKQKLAAYQKELHDKAKVE